MTQVATRPGRISAQEDFLPTQLEHLHIAQFKGEHLKKTKHKSVNVIVLSDIVSGVPTADDISGALQTLRSFLLFYPSDKDSLDNLQLYLETLGGDVESQSTEPAQVPPLFVHHK